MHTTIHPLQSRFHDMKWGMYGTENHTSQPYQYGYHTHGHACHSDTYLRDRQAYAGLGWDWG